MTTILLIDLSSIAHPLWHTTQGSSNPNECSIATVAKVRALASGQPHVAVCCDSGRSFRRDVDPTYKAQRPEADATLMHQITLAIETLKADGFPVWAVKGFEADDLIATATHRCLTVPAMFVADAFTAEQIKAAGNVPYIPISNGHPRPEIIMPSVLIASSDKDMLQLVSDRVSVHRVLPTTKATTVTPDVVRAELGIEPNQMTEWLMLVGDASDNIKGAEGIGPKTASAMLTKYGNLADFYAAFDADPLQFKPSTVKAMMEFRARMDTVRQLVTLRTDVPLPFEEVFRERVPCDVAAFGEDEPMEEQHAEEQKPVDERREAASTEQAQGAQPPPPGQVTQPAAAPTTSTKPTREGSPFDDMMSKSASIGDYERELEPRNLRDASLLSIEIHKSRLYSAYGTWQGVLTTILAGRELGMQAMASLRAFHIIDGKPTMSADLIRALVLKSGHAEYFRCTTRTPTQATFVTKRKGDPEVSLTFTVEDGRRAWPKDQSSFDKSGWGKNPADMCVARASAKLARLVYADVVFNMYAPEEMD